MNCHIENHLIGRRSMRLTPHERRIVEIIISRASNNKEEDRFVWQYLLSDIMKIGTRPNIRDCVMKLQNLELIELRTVRTTESKRQKKYYGLSFKGILYALKSGFVDPSEARDLRLASKVRLPLEIDLPDNQTLQIRSQETVIKVEEEAPHFFYSYLMLMDLYYYEVGLIVFLTALPSIMDYLEQVGGPKGFVSYFLGSELPEFLRDRNR